MAMSDLRCKNCAFYVSMKRKEESGDCQRYPPQLVFDEDSNRDDRVFSRFPQVHPLDWCGEFKRRDELMPSEHQ